MHARTVSFSHPLHLLWIVPLSFVSFQAQKTATRLWSENVVLDTSQTFGVTHESRFFDWGEQLTFMLPDMDRIVRHFRPLSSPRTSFPLAILVDFQFLAYSFVRDFRPTKSLSPSPFSFEFSCLLFSAFFPSPFALSSLLSLGCMLLLMAMYSFQVTEGASDLRVLIKELDPVCALIAPLANLPLARSRIRLKDHCMPSHLFPLLRTRLPVAISYIITDCGTHIHAHHYDEHRHG